MVWSVIFYMLCQQQAYLIAASWLNAMETKCDDLYKLKPLLEWQRFLYPYYLRLELRLCKGWYPNLTYLIKLQIMAAMLNVQLILIQISYFKYHKNAVPDYYLFLSST